MMKTKHRIFLCLIMIGLCLEIRKEKKNKEHSEIDSMNYYLCYILYLLIADNHVANIISENYVLYACFVFFFIQARFFLSFFSLNN